MREFSPDGSKDKAGKMVFRDMGEAVSYIIESVNKDRRELQVVANNFFEQNIRSYVYLLEFMKLLCERLEHTYGFKIDFEALIEAARADVDQDWPNRKERIMGLGKLFRQVDGIFKKDSP